MSSWSFYFKLDIGFIRKHLKLIFCTKMTLDRGILFLPGRMGRKTLTAPAKSKVPGRKPASGSKKGFVKKKSLPLEGSTKRFRVNPIIL